MNSARVIKNFNTPEVVKHIQTVVDARSSAKPIRHFGITPEIDEDNKNGSLSTFRFVSLTKFDDGIDCLPFSVQQNQLTTALKLSHPQGVILQSKEKSAVYPALQFLFGNHSEIRDENYIIQGYTTCSSLYQEMRKIDCDVVDDCNFRQNINYIVIGFKTTDVKYNRALLDSWKDWTGARYIYINFPDQLDLIKITLYHKQCSDDLNLFSYVVIVKCGGIDTKEKEIILLDFVQRFRAQKMSNFVSVYEEVIK